jgi:predicted DNA-binding WGR domain protein
MECLIKRFQNTNKRRYYQLYLAKDLLGDWVLIKSWGALDSSRGRVVHLQLPNYLAGLQQIENLAKTRMRRGYVVS